MAELILKNVYKRYDNTGKKKHDKIVEIPYAVNNFSFSCREGEFIGILGPSGCGKSTTLRMIAGLEKITAGDIYIGNVRINDLHPKDRNIGLAFEDYALYPPLTVYDNLAFNLRAKRVPEEEIKKAINYVAPLMKVEDLLNAKPVSLSGGQKQRVNIARAIIRKPELLLLDEPLSHLDGKMRQSLRHEIKRMHHEIKCTTIIVTHDQMEAMSLADRIVIMKDGELQQIGTPMEVYNDPSNEFVAGFIGEPPMNLLKSKIAKTDSGFKFTFKDSDLIMDVPRGYFDVVKNGMEVTIGVRPVDVLINNTNGKPIPVATYENLGDERRVSVRVGENLLNLTTQKQVLYEQGEIIRLEFNAELTHIFDIKTGHRIRAKK